jgi:transposase
MHLLDSVFVLNCHCFFLYCLVVLPLHYAPGPTFTSLFIGNTPIASHCKSYRLPSMHIPQAYSLQRGHDQIPAWSVGTGHVPSHASVKQADLHDSWEFLIHELIRRSGIWMASMVNKASQVRKRTASQDMDTTIGIVVGVLVGVFIVASIAFLHIYRGSIRVKRRKRRHHHRHSKSSSSKSSKASDGGGSAASAAAEEPPPAA